MDDYRIVYKLDEIVTILEDANRKMPEQDDYGKLIRESIDGFWKREDSEASDIRIKVVYDNPSGLDYIIATYDKVRFKGKSIVIENDKDSFSIINGDCIKRIDVKDMS